MPFISVIVPVYNAEKTINRCVDSIINQEFEDYELILVNDGSADNSGKICKEYAQKNFQIKYIEKENGGVSSARNLGIEKAEGKYIAFVDSDDYVSNDYFDSIYGSVKDFDWDYVIFSYYNHRKSQIDLRQKKNFETVQKDMVFKTIENLICNKSINSPCARIYKSEIVKKNAVDFTAGASVAEDRAFNIKYSMNINSLKISDRAVYHVCLDKEDSLSRSKVRKNLQNDFYLTQQDIDMALSESKLEDKYKNNIVTAMNFCSYRSVYSNAKRNRQAEISSKERIKQIKADCKRINEQKLSYPNTKYCHLICIPVKLRLIKVIDLVAWKLAK